MKRADGKGNSPVAIWSKRVLYASPSPGSSNGQFRHADSFFAPAPTYFPRSRPRMSDLPRYEAGEGCDQPQSEPPPRFCPLGQAAALSLRDEIGQGALGKAAKGAQNQGGAPEAQTSWLDPPDHVPGIPRRGVSNDHDRRQDARSHHLRNFYTHCF